MTPDALDSVITKIVLALAGSAFGAGVMDQSTAATIAAGAVALASFAYGVYKHWNMRKVSKDAVVVGGK